MLVLGVAVVGYGVFAIAYVDSYSLFSCIVISVGYSWKSIAY